MFADGGYAKRSWEELITSGIADDKAAFERSPEWIRTQSLSADCVALLASHDTGVQPHVIEFQKTREHPSSFCLFNVSFAAAEFQYFFVGFIIDVLESDKISRFTHPVKHGVILFEL